MELLEYMTLMGSVALIGSLVVVEVLSASSQRK